MVVRYEDWAPNAACLGRDDVEWFDRRPSADAIALCGQCPVRGECFLEAIDRNFKEDCGIWAATNELQREAIRRGDYEVWQLWQEQGYPYRPGEVLARGR